MKEVLETLNRFSTTLGQQEFYQIFAKQDPLLLLISAGSLFALVLMVRSIFRKGSAQRDPRFGQLSSSAPESTRDFSAFEKRLEQFESRIDVIHRDVTILAEQMMREKQAKLKKAGIQIRIDSKRATRLEGLT